MSLISPIELQYFPLFKEVASERISELLSRCHCRFKNFSTNEMVALAGEEVTEVMIIFEGELRAEMVDSAGKIFRIEDLNQGMIVSPAFIFGDQPFLPVNVVANCDSKLLIISKTDFIEMLHNDQAMMLNFIRIISNRTYFLADKIKKVLLQSLVVKVATYLHQQSADQKSLLIKLPHNQNWLAEKFGVARPSIARIFAELKVKGIIDCKGRDVNILNMKLLKSCIQN